MKEKIQDYFKRFIGRDTVYEAGGKLFHDKCSAQSYAGDGKVTEHSREKAAEESEKPKKAEESEKPKKVEDKKPKKPKKKGE